MIVLRWLFFPISLIYGLIMSVRNYLFRKEVYKAYQSKFKVLSVGNLSVGGTGKTPMIEFLLKELKLDFSIATLSRGYGRKTTGFLKASKSSSAQEIGDEPYQFYKKWGNEIKVAVDEKRANGLQQLEKLCPETELVLLDDAYQHQWVKRDLNILLTTYDKPFFTDFVLPTGMLREFRTEAKRAGAVVVTKCPKNLSEVEKKNFTEQITKYKSGLLVFFSSIKYGVPNAVFNKETVLQKEVVAISGIAKPKPFLDHLKKEYAVKHHFEFPDHHQFSTKDLDQILVKLSEKRQCIITTEKDMVRLLAFEDHEIFKKHDLFVLPITIELDKPKALKKLILETINDDKKD